jgi:hypothetical protein
MMYENVGTVFLLDKAVPFLVVKPLYDTIRHCGILLS